MTYIILFSYVNYEWQGKIFLYVLIFFSYGINTVKLTLILKRLCRLSNIFLFIEQIFSYLKNKSSFQFLPVVFVEKYATKTIYLSQEINIIRKLSLCSRLNKEKFYQRKTISFHSLVAQLKFSRIYIRIRKF